MKRIDQLGYVQIDSINVLERAHHLTLITRLPGSDRKVLTQLLQKRRSAFEHWTHDASIIPSRWFRYWRLRFPRAAKRIRSNAWWNERMGKKPNQAINYVLKRIEREGSLMAKDFEHDRRREAGTWWEWKPAKAALEFLWHTGRLAVTARRNFHKVYDLTDRVLPAHVLAESIPDKHEHINWACRTALDRLAFATPGEIAAFFRAVSPADAKHWCGSTLKKGHINEVVVESVDGSKPRGAYAVVDWEERLAKSKPPPDEIRLLGPFDPVLRNRKRAKRLFDFDYTFEGFVPSAKRIYGYYVLAILQGDRLIGRLDPKLHRDQKQLEIKGVWWEPKVKVTKARRKELKDAVESLAQFVGASEIRWPEM
ncbi:MAG: winged helix DNA-binding domain-containing protein [Planctomycetota bacterium]|nr:winged helix DNA-binding domain-containing protein [Planctomycetota bacterium]